MSDTRKIDWSAVPFDSLTIPEEKKEVVMALAHSRIGEITGATFDDVVEGKGRGLNILLQYSLKVTIPSMYADMNSGPPGVGKTLTAEAISEHFHRPLYSVCGMP